MRINLLAATLCLGALVSVAAGAAELASAPLSGAGPDNCVCRIASLSSKAHQLTIELVDATGVVLTTEVVTLQPGGTISQFFACGASNPNFVRVSGKFPRKKLRGVYCVTASNTEGICVPLE